MERIKGVTPAEAGWIARFIYRALEKRLGLIPKTKLLAAYDTQLLMASSWIDMVDAAAKTVPASLKELAKVKVAMMAGCPF